MGFPAKQASKRRNLAAPLWGFYWPDTQSLLHWDLCGVNFASYWKRDSTGHLSVVTRECCSTQGVMVKKSGSPAFCCVPFSLRGTRQTPYFVIRQMRWNQIKKNQKNLTFWFYFWNVWRRPVSRSSAVPWNVVSKAKMPKEKNNSNRIARMFFVFFKVL